MQTTEATKKIKQLYNEMYQLRQTIGKIEVIIESDKNNLVRNSKAVKVTRLNSLREAKLKLSLKRKEYNALLDSFSPEELKDILNSI